MNLFVRLITQNKLFYGLSLLLIVVTALFLSLVSRVEGFVFLNSFHTKTLNLIFNAITFLGDGVFTLLICVVVLIFFKKHSNLVFILLLAYLGSGLLAQFFKAIIHAPRPSLYFKLHNYKLYLDTFSNSRAGFNSFPSGHSSSVFALFTVLSIYCKRKWVCYSSIIIAALAGYSRIYLAHHFLIDVFVGGIIGLIFGTVSIIWFENKGTHILKRVQDKLKLTKQANFTNSNLIN
jgi:undecaprenyl-diphosphatase